MLPCIQRGLRSGVGADRLGELCDGLFGEVARKVSFAGQPVAFDDRNPADLVILHGVQDLGHVRLGIDGEWVAMTTPNPNRRRRSPPSYLDAVAFIVFTVPPVLPQSRKSPQPGGCRGTWVSKLR